MQSRVKRTGDVMRCGLYKVKLLEHVMQIVERVLERRIQILISLNEMRFGSKSRKTKSGCNIHCKENARGTSKKDKKLYMCFVDIEKEFDRVPRKVIKWAMIKRSFSEAMYRAVMSLYEV